MAPYSLLSATGIELDGSIVEHIEGNIYVRIDTVSKAEFTVNNIEQTISLRFPIDFHKRSLISIRQGETNVPVAGSGSFLNYVVAATGSRNFEANGFAELVVHPFGGAFVASGIARSGSGGSAIRLDTSFTRDWTQRLLSLRIGDAVALGGAGVASIRFTGIQFSHSYTLDPMRSTIPLPSINGSSELPSTVDLLLGERKVLQLEFGPGPFTLRDIPAVSGAGEASIVVRDALGRRIVTTVPFYTAVGALAAGLHEYEFEAGATRLNYGLHSNDYGALFAGTTQRYGLANWLTLEARVEASKMITDFGAGGILTVGSLGSIFAHAAMSQSGGRTGSALAVGVERRSSRFSLGGSFEAQSAYFRTLGRGSSIVFPVYTAQTFASVNFNRYSLGTTAVVRHNRERPDDRVIGLTTQAALFRGSLILSIQHTSGSLAETIASVRFTLPLGSRAGMSSGVIITQGRATAAFSAERNPPVGEGQGWAVDGAIGRASYFAGRYQLNTAPAIFMGEVYKSSGATSLGAEIDGSLVFNNGHLAALRPIYDSYAIVDLGRNPGVQVFADEHLVGRTNQRGILYVPDLRSFDTSNLRIEPTDISIDHEITVTSKVVRPARRAGVDVKFRVSEQQSQIRRFNFRGRPIPAGAEAQTKDGVVLPVASGGRVLFPDDTYDSGVEFDLGDGAHCHVAPGALGGLSPNVEVQCI